MHLDDTQINDLADGTLTGDELLSAQHHLAGCVACAAELAGARAVLLRIRQLPRSIEPQHDLRPGIWAHADRKTLWSWRYQLAVAAVLLIAASSVITATLISRRDDSNVTVTRSDRPASVDLVSLERQYSAEVDDLQRVLQRNREQLAPETVKILQENLRIIDAAIQEARAALARDPQSAMLGELLRSAYQRKLDLLKQAARSSAET